MCRAALSFCRVLASGFPIVSVASCQGGGGGTTCSAMRSCSPDAPAAPAACPVTSPDAPSRDSRFRDPRFRLGRSSAGLGLFATVAFPAGARVIEYTGERITTAEADRRGGRYLFAVDDRWVIDARDRDNLARYINHACRPNCEARQVGRRIWIYARRPIAPGEELTYHYGKVYFQTFIAPHGCRCAACRRRRAA